MFPLGGPGRAKARTPAGEGCRELSSAAPGYMEGGASTVGGSNLFASRILFISARSLIAFELSFSFLLVVSKQ